MLAASMAVGHLLTTTEREPLRPPHRHQARLALGTSGMALSQLAWAHSKAVEAIPPPRGSCVSEKNPPRNALETVVL
jgi:hypothetical protein